MLSFAPGHNATTHMVTDPVIRTGHKKNHTENATYVAGLEIPSWGMRRAVGLCGCALCCSGLQKRCCLPRVKSQ